MYEGRTSHAPPSLLAIRESMLERPVLWNDLEEDQILESTLRYIGVLKCSQFYQPAVFDRLNDITHDLEVS